MAGVVESEGPPDRIDQRTVSCLPAENLQRYEATVVDSDDLSLTVIFRDDDKKWKAALASAKST